MGETETLGGHKQNLVHTRTQKKGAAAPQKTEPDTPVSVLESLAEASVSSGLQRDHGHWQQQFWEAWHAGVSLLEDVTITPTIDPIAYHRDCRL